MKFILCSQSQIKLAAVKNALVRLGIEAEVVGVKARSNVAEQPIDGETLQGAKNRAIHARKLAGDGDFYIAIENGVYAEVDGRFVDKAVVLVIAKDGAAGKAFSEGVEFPKASVEEARRRGFATTTVGQVMAEQGLVAKPDDCSLSLIGRSRVDILTDTVADLLSKKLKWVKGISERMMGIKKAP